MQAKSPFYHFSVDDVFDMLIEITDQNIPLSKHPYFEFLGGMHEEFDAHIALYLFLQKRINNKLRSLAEIRDIKKELSQAGDWLRFGPHALDAETPPYSETSEEQKKIFDFAYSQIDRFAGSHAHAEWLRLHSFSESYELADYFALKGVRALFSTDKIAGSYRMPEKIHKRLNRTGSASYQGMDFIRTQFRVENFANDRLAQDEIKKRFREALEKFGYIILLTHEYELARDDVRAYIHTSLDLLKSLGIPSTKTP